jgi:hypothetical protein
MSLNIESLLACYDLSWIVSGKDYWYAIVSAVIGSLIGIWWARREFQKQVRVVNEKVRLSILSSLSFSKERAIQARNQLQKSRMPNYPLDGSRLSSLIVQARGCLNDELLSQLDEHRYDLEHITSKLGIVNDYYLLGTTLPSPAKPQHDEWMKMLRESLVEHYDKVINATDPLIQAVEKAHAN